MSNLLDITSAVITDATETESGCWLPRTKTVVNEQGKQEDTRRFSLRAISDVGPGFRKGATIYNSCSTPGCIHPDHLYQHDDKQAFMRSVRVQLNGCWDFTALATNGYGVYRTAGGKSELAHRYSYKLHTGKEIPSGKQVMHSCDRKCCVNPGHLSVGTAKDNAIDKVNKGRANIKHGKRPRVTQDKLATIKKLAAEGVTGYAIAKSLKLTVQNVYAILRRQPKPPAPQESEHARAA